MSGGIGTPLTGPPAFGECFFKKGKQMKTLLAIVFLIICLLMPGSAFADIREYGNKAAKEAKNDAKMKRLALRTDKAIRQIILHSVDRLKRKGFKKEANEILWTYDDKFQNYLERITVEDKFRNIGDFEPLSNFLEETYLKIEALIGKEACELLRITDLRALNFEIPVCFDPCNPKWNVLEFGYHFAGGPDKNGNYTQGLLPITSYWLTIAGCSYLTLGTGYWLICSPIASIAEYEIAQYVAPPLGAMLYVSLCPGP